MIASDRAKNERHVPAPRPAGREGDSVHRRRDRDWNAAKVVLSAVDTGGQRVLLQGGADARYVDTGHLVYVKAGTLMAVPFDLRSQQISGSPVAVLENVMQR